MQYQVKLSETKSIVFAGTFSFKKGKNLAWYTDITDRLVSINFVFRLAYYWKRQNRQI